MSRIDDLTGPDERGFGEAPSGLRHRTVKGIGWSLGGQVAQQVIRFAVYVGLARLLFPEDFGLIGMVFVFTGFVGLFAELGLGAAIVHRHELTSRYLSTAFWLNMAAGLGIAVLLAASAPLVAAFYGEPQLTLLTAVIAASFVLSAASVVQRALLTRSMDFRRLAVIETSGALAGGIIALSAAAAGAGVWSLVTQVIVETGVVSGILWFLSTWRPQLTVDRMALRDLWAFGGNLTGFRIVNYWARRFDDLLVGRVLGAAPLGIYTRAYSAMLMPVTHLSSVIGRVMFPALASLRGDVDRVRTVYRRAIGIIALIAFPAMTGLLIVAPDFVLGLLGSRWDAVIPLLRILCVAGLLQAIGHTTGWIYQALGRTDLMFRWGVANSIVTILAVVVGIRWGLVGVATAYAVRSAFAFVANLAVAGRLIRLRLRDVLLDTWQPLAVSVVMAIVVATVSMVLTDMGHLTRLLAQAAVGLVAYSGLIVAVRLRAYQQLVALVRDSRVEHADTP